MIYQHSFLNMRSLIRHHNLFILSAHANAVHVFSIITSALWLYLIISITFQFHFFNLMHFSSCLC